MAVPKAPAVHPPPPVRTLGPPPGSSATTGTGPLLGQGLLKASVWELRTKRTVDVTVSLVLLIVLAPLLAVVALVVMASSRGSALYLQERCGGAGQRFRMWKFRSMYHDADQRLGALSHLNEMEGGPAFKLRNDPRITPVGRVLRRWSIDELPQLMNVLRGEMSLVGPRPPLPAEVARYTEHQQGRLAVKPGVTCIWQVSGRSDLDFATWVDMDLEYIRSWSLLLDLKLLLLTVPAVLLARGAY